MKTIQLTQGQVAQVDDEDYEWLSAHKWYAHWDKTTKSFYAVRSQYLGKIDGKYKHRNVYMHRAILGLEHGNPLTGDHRETGKTLNNTRANLRIAGDDEQQHNKRTQINNTSGYKGVSKSTKGIGYLAQIQRNGTSKYLGTRDTPEAAHALYAQAAHEQFGEFARLA